MENTITKLLFLLVVTGALATGCTNPDASTDTTAVDATVTTESQGSLEKSVMGTPAAEEATPETTPATAPAQAPEATTPAKTPTPVTEPAPTTEPAPVTTETTTTTTETSTYKDGTYTATGSYNSPAGLETVGVTLTLKDDKITAVSTTADAANETSKMCQDLFSQGISGVVIGKSLSGLSVSAVNGTSLTPKGFNSAVASIQAQAKL